MYFKFGKFSDIKSETQTSSLLLGKKSVVCWVIYVEWKIGFYHKYFYLLKKHTIKVNNKNETEWAFRCRYTWIGFFYLAYNFYVQFYSTQNHARSMVQLSSLFFHFVPGGIRLLLFSLETTSFYCQKYTQFFHFQKKILNFVY